MIFRIIKRMFGNITIDVVSMMGVDLEIDKCPHCGATESPNDKVGIFSVVSGYATSFFGKKRWVNDVITCNECKREVHAKIRKVSIYVVPMPSLLSLNNGRPY